MIYFSSNEERSASRLKVPTLLFPLPLRDHLVQLPLDQPVPLVLVQPLPARERLLDARERAVYHNLERGSRRLVGEGHCES